jgi:hypothetical protein
LDGKKNAQAIVHDFLFRRMISCANCHYSLIGEKQKGYVYYRCHSKGCPTLTIREDLVVAAFQARLRPLHFEDAEVAELRSMIAEYFDKRSERREEHIRALNLRLESSNARLSRLIDAYTDGMIERSLFAEKKQSLLMEQKALEEKRDLAIDNSSHFSERLDGILERLKSLPLSYEIANAAERQLLLQEITSNIRVDRKNLEITLRSPFQEIGNLSVVSTCGLVRDRPRTGGGAAPDRHSRQHVRIKAVFDALLAHCNATEQNSRTREFADLSDTEPGAGFSQSFEDRSVYSETTWKKQPAV